MFTDLVYYIKLLGVNSRHYHMTHTQTITTGPQPVNLIYEQVTVKSMIMQKMQKLQMKQLTLHVI